MTTKAAKRPRNGELRSLVAPVEFRDTTGNEWRVSGHAAVFNSRSEYMGFYEEIAPGAFRAALAKPGADAMLCWSHDTSKPLARVSAGNLRLSEDQTGLAFTADLVPTSVAKDAILLMRAGVVRSMSFGFTVKRDSWSRTSDGEELRRILEIGDLMEVSLVSNPAYPATTATPDVRAAITRARQLPKDNKNMSPKTAAERHRALAAARARHPAPSVRVTERTPYGAASEHSWVLDVAAGVDGGNDHAARQRLQRHEAAETRAVSSSVFSGIVPPNFPLFTAEAVAQAVRAGAPLAMALEQLDLPAEGTTISWSKFSPGANVGNQGVENTAVPVSADAAVLPTISPLATISATMDFAVQGRDRSGGWFDLEFTRDLGAAWAARLEQQVWSGIGASGQMLGLTASALSGNSSSTVSGQTMPLTMNQITNQWQTVFANLGAAPDVVAMHPRRAAILDAATDAASLPLTGILPPGCTLVVSAAAPTNLGGGTEDWIVVLNRASTPLVIDPNGPAVEFHNESSLGTSLTIRALVYAYATLGTTRRPEGIGQVRGLTPPTFT